MTSVLFSPFSLRSLTLANRIVVSPMCRYSAEHDPAIQSAAASLDAQIK